MRRLDNKGSKVVPDLALAGVYTNEIEVEALSKNGDLMC